MNMLSGFRNPFLAIVFLYSIALPMTGTAAGTLNGIAMQQNSSSQRPAVPTNPPLIPKMKLQDKGATIAMVGIITSTRNGETIILSVVPHSSAERNGLRPLDQIIALNNQSVSAMSEDALKKLWLGTNGSSLSLRIQHDKEQKTVSVIRDSFFDLAPEFSVSEKNGVAIVIPRMIQEWTLQNFRSEMAKLVTPRLRGIILDLRNNDLSSIAGMLVIPGAFVKKHTIVAHCTANFPKELRTTENPLVPQDIPVAVLVNNGTKSTAEFIAHVLHANRKAVVLAERTFDIASTGNNAKSLQDAMTETLCVLQPTGNATMGTLLSTADFSVRAGTGKRDAALEKALKVLLNP